MTTETFESWAIVELMGHRKRTGYAKEVEIAGGKMLRIDIPVSATDSVTEFYGSSAIYAIRPSTEEIAREVYRRVGSDPRPIRPVDYRPPAIEAAEVDEDDDADEVAF